MNNYEDEQAKLLPCPFCGGEAKVHEIAAEEYCAICGSCQSNGTVFVSMMDDVSEQVIEHWNRRAVPAPPEPRTTGLTFGEALVALQAGKRIARDHWEGQYLLIDGPAICGKLRNGSIINWAPHSMDLLATDWYIVTGE